jgi:hypothetical protein
MRHRRIATMLAVGVLSAPLAFSEAAAELAAWDQAKVSALAKELVAASDALYDTFYKQPPPTLGSGQASSYQRLKQKVRRIRTEARQLSEDVQKNAGREETLPSFQDLMQTVRDAREEARKVFQTADVAEKAAAARAVLNQLGPYYDPDFKALEPVAR